MKKLASIFLLALTVSVSYSAPEVVGVKISLISTNVAYAVFPPGACVDYVGAKGDTAAGFLKFYTASAPFAVTNSAAAGVTNIETSGTALAVGDVVVLHSPTLNRYQRVIVSTTNAAGFHITNDLSAATTDFALVANGANAYKMTVATCFNIPGLVLAQLAGGGGSIFADPNNRPIMVEASCLTGLSTNVFLSVSGRR